ncbi:hypothetical protein GCM10010177_58630 [Actinomadura citrea]|nr:hypothetical protein GCM10010177_58630 [Actinomadura citrea]
MNTISASVHAAQAVAVSDAARRHRRAAGVRGTNTAATSSHPTVRTAATSPPSRAVIRPDLVSAPAWESPGAAVSLNAPPSRTTSARTTSAIAPAPIASIGTSVRADSRRSPWCIAVASCVATAANTHASKQKVH